MYSILHLPLSVFPSRLTSNSLLVPSSFSSNKNSFWKLDRKRNQLEISIYFAYNVYNRNKRPQNSRLLLKQHLKRDLNLGRNHTDLSKKCEMQYLHIKMWFSTTGKSSFIKVVTRVIRLRNIFTTANNAKAPYRTKTNCWENKYNIQSHIPKHDYIWRYTM